MIVPSGRKTPGPTSTEFAVPAPVSARLTPVSTAASHAFVAGLYTSERCRILESTVSTLPFGRMVQFSSSLESSLPVGASAVKVSVAGLNEAISVPLVVANSIVPLGKMMDWASPIPSVPRPLVPVKVAGTVSCDDHVFVTGSYRNPMLVQVCPLVLYSPPITTTRPSDSTAEAKKRGAYTHGAQPPPAVVVSVPFGMFATVNPGTSHDPFR